LSSARAIQQPALDIWQGEKSSVVAARRGERFTADGARIKVI
jgi:hypothetical protein